MVRYVQCGHSYQPSGVHLGLKPIGEPSRSGMASAAKGERQSNGFSILPGQPFLEKS